jgi:hypothetical protein
VATVTGLTKAKMLEIEAASIVGGVIDGLGHLILTRHDGGTIDAGSTVAPEFVPGGAIGYAELAAGQRWEPGDFKWSMQTADHAGWLKMDGRNTLARVGTYAALFAVVGVSLGAGADGTKFGIGDVSKRVPMGKTASGVGSTLGGTGGSSDAVLASHDHTVDSHSHGGSVNGEAVHVHNMNHGHSADDSAEGSHSHDSTSGATNVIGTVSGPYNVNGSGSNYVTFDVAHAIRTDVQPDHDHDITVIDFAGNNGGGSSHAHGIPGDSPGTDAQGVSGTDANLPPFLVMNGFIHI